MSSDTVPASENPNSNSAGFKRLKLVVAGLRLPWNTEEKDFTVSIPSAKADQVFSAAGWQMLSDQLQKTKSLHTEVSVVTHKSSQKGRAVFCLCCKGQYLSATIRLKERCQILKAAKGGQLIKCTRRCVSRRQGARVAQTVVSGRQIVRRQLLEIYLFGRLRPSTALGRNLASGLSVNLHNMVCSYLQVLRSA